MRSTALPPGDDRRTDRAPAAARESQAASRSARGGALLVVGAVLGLLLAGLLLHPVLNGESTDLSLFGVTLPSVCWFRRATGLPCAGCGLTRSVVLLLHGRFAESSAQHPFGIVVIAMALLQLPPRIASGSGRAGSWISRWDRVWTRAAIAALVLLFLRWAVHLASLF